MAKQVRVERGGRGRGRRDRAKEVFWRGVVDDQEASSLGVRAFCRDRGVAEASFYHWRRELRSRRLEESRAGGAREASPCMDAGDGASHEQAPSSVFAEVRLPERTVREIEIRRGDVSVFFRGGCDERLVREALSLTGGAPC